ncbi:HpcH/HpaI aldolase/citrate lyase family protein [Cohnella cholangitidis]|uniref:HpcH/HpaI aldolase/citrate lyase family protein n=1 Tax=Cohnella cholangitidis TaxID=2598458 RepID=A0A7G5BWW6_9BACL|nr:HpcH/HpaI aldolase/citrate lyase family protein [Cohnella cholangitidis]QMV41450.1 HpcH/HpaI aldolase/citrate lyase family protein [Cohnella cholangitidis]
MRYFDYLTPEQEHDIFHYLPTEFNNRTDQELLAYAVGAALYMPATRPTIAEDIASKKIKGLVSLVIDLEDAVGDNQVQLAEENLCRTMDKLEACLNRGQLNDEGLPLLFVRVRSSAQFERLLPLLGDQIRLITGFAFPKFTASEGEVYFRILEAYNKSKAPDFPILYGMPILETPEVIYRESRLATLLGIQALLTKYKPYVLNVRIGATDFSSMFGLRRNPDMTIYDIGVIRDCVTDIINIFGREDNRFVISGPVWEYFRSDRVLKPQLRATPFQEMMGKDGLRLRMSYLDRYVDGLIREVAYDKENGIIGKTIIHPTHLQPVQSLYVVTHEEYIDAMSIISNSQGDLGVMKSRYENKMNEIKPHLNWSNRIMIRAKIFGVLHDKHNFTCLLADSQREGALV